MDVIKNNISGLIIDINKYYSKYSFKLNISDLDNWLLNKNSVFDFFGQAFNKREFNVDVTESYITRILKDYDLSIAQIEEYGKKIRFEKQEDNKRRKKKNKIILISSSIAIILISVSTYSYNLYSERQEEIKEQLRLEKIELEEKRDEKLNVIIEDYIGETDNRNLEKILSFWSDQPTRYWDINKNNESGFISKSKIEESILKAFNLNSFSENEIKNISKTDEGEYNVSVLFKFTSKKTGIVKHIKSTTILKFNQDDKIVQEYGMGNPIIMYNSSKKVKKRYSDGSYEGNLINNKREGYGRFIHNDGTIYEGEFSGDKLNGKGKMVWKNGDVYVGEFKDGELIGYGKMVWKNGGLYEGDYLDGKRTGFGKYKWPSGGVYEGEFQDNKRTGSGKYKWPNGDVYVGEFKDGELNGYGKMIRKDGSEDEGKWLNNTLLNKANSSKKVVKEGDDNLKTETKKNKKALTDVEFINLKYHWNPGEPTGSQNYVFMNSDSGKWFDHHNTLNNDGYGLYQINKPLSNISNTKYNDFDNYIFLGEVNGITYFFDKRISSAKNYLKSRPLNGDGAPVVLDSDEKINSIKSLYSGRPTKAFWIGLKLVNNDWVWLSK